MFKKISKVVLIVSIILWLCMKNKITAKLDIYNIQTMGEGRLLAVNATIHSDHKHFDLFIDIQRDLNQHNLYANMKFKMKPLNATDYRVLFSWKRIDLCKFLANIRNDTIFQLFFRNQMFSIIGMTCPIRKRLYYFKNIGIAERLTSDSLQNGKYRFFMEVAQLSGDFVKLFAIQIHAAYK